MAGTTMAAVKANLKTALLARAGLSGVKVTYGHPGGNATGREIIWLGSTNTEGTQTVPSMRAGTKRRHEDYTLNVYIEVLGHSPEKCEQRACSISAEIEDYIASDTSVNSTPGVAWAIVTGMEMDTAETVDGSRTVIRIQVSVKGNLL